jgi:hypothetical protein
MRYVLRCISVVLCMILISPVFSIMDRTVQSGQWEITGKDSGDHTQSIDSLNNGITTPVFEYALQVGAFVSKINALKIQRKLSDAGYDAKIYENYLSEDNLYYLVWVGSFPSVEQVEFVRRKIKHQYKIYGVLRMRSVTFFPPIDKSFLTVY